MRRIQKITQQRRRQLHVHLPVSGLLAMPCSDDMASARLTPKREPVELAEVKLRLKA
ncbi:hypothetical protein [Pseudomonas sp. UFMG81]|jgi:hypothetical protein|uniref:hypothetical protein n=1 Tax=Pseudomonas sp. UFMG81 TaxID=2745936 RepID=UPI00188F32D8|nr:hypothetical protein [Pseudomonas sp. UFMG81]